MKEYFPRFWTSLLYAWIYKLHKFGQRQSQWTDQVLQQHYWDDLSFSQPVALSNLFIGLQWWSIWFFSSESRNEECRHVIWISWFCGDSYLGIRYIFSCDEQLKKWRCHFVRSSIRSSVLSSVRSSILNIIFLFSKMNLWSFETLQNLM